MFPFEDSRNPGGQQACERGRRDEGGATTGVRRFGFELSRCVVVDVESYRNRWAVGVYSPRHAEVVDGDPGRLGVVLGSIRRRGRTVVSYNGDSYDIPLLRAMLAGWDADRIKRLGDLRIEESRDWRPWRERESEALLAGLPDFPCDHVDLFRRNRAGLKTILAHLGFARVEELPYPPDATLTDEQWAHVLRYNRLTDLPGTWAVLETYADEIGGLAALSARYGLDLRSEGRADSLGRILDKVYAEANGGRRPPRPQFPRAVLPRPIPGIPRPATPGAGEWYDTAMSVPIPTDKEELDESIYERTFAIGATEYRARLGGLHSVDHPAEYRPDADWDLVDADIASDYPSVILAGDIRPAAIGALFPRFMGEVLDLRLEYKRLAKSGDPAVAANARLLAGALKIVLNAAFGKMGSPYGTLYDPACFYTVTINGQAALIDLIERLESAGCRVVMANTDGITFFARRGDDVWRAVAESWQSDTHMTLESAPLRSLCVLANNRYIAVDAGGKVKRKGRHLLDYDEEGLKSNSELIINDALVAAIVEDVPPEVTVRRCREIVRFCGIAKFNEASHPELVDDRGSRQPVGKVLRFYHAGGVGNRVMVRSHRTDKATGEVVEVEAKRGGTDDIRPAMDLPPGIPADLDHGYYIRAARKELGRLSLERHRDPAILPDHPIAREIAAHGLIPVPKWEKGVFAGADPNCPTYLWDWGDGRVTAGGCYTGPRTGIWMLDSDEFEKFRSWVDRGRSPLLLERWEDLAGCLVSCHGATTAESVRRGEGRGKLIFRERLPEDHPLWRVAADKRKEEYGVEIFARPHIPTILGRHPSGEWNRLEGTLGPSPVWLLDLATQGTRPKKPRTRPAAAPPEEDGPEWDVGLAEIMAPFIAAVPELAGLRVVPRTTDTHGTFAVCPGACPGPHRSGRRSPGTLSFHPPFEGGPPRCVCKRASCEYAPVVNALVREGWGRRNGHVPHPGPIDVPGVELNELGRAVEADLDVPGRTSYHLARTGEGKSYQAARIPLVRLALGRCTVVAVPTLKLLRAYEEAYRALAPDLLADGTIAIISHQARPDRRDDADLDDADDEDDAGKGRYPITKHARIVALTHARLLRRRFSRTIRAIWRLLGPTDDRPAFDFLIDEGPAFLDACQVTLPLGHRYRRREEAMGGRLVPTDRCPMSARSGHCGNCTASPIGGEIRLSYGMRECRPVREIELDPDGACLRRIKQPFDIGPADFELGPRGRVGGHVWSAVVRGYKGRSFHPLDRPTAPVFVHGMAPQDRGPEPVDEVLEHFLRFALDPVVNWSHPVDRDGGIVDSGELAARAQAKAKGWSEGTLFPYHSCEVGRLVFTDMLGVEMLRRYQEEHGAAVAFLGAMEIPSDLATLRAAWPGLAVRRHEAEGRRIHQAAFAFLDGSATIKSLLAEDRTLRTAALERHGGLGIIFGPRRQAAVELYALVRDTHPSCRLADGNDRHETLLHGHDRAEERVIITYSRGVLGIGANLLGLRYLVLDAHAYQSPFNFNPDESTPEAFAQVREDDRAAICFQNIGRAFRGEEDKTVVILVLNADPAFREAIRLSPGAADACERPPVFVAGPDLANLIDAADRWLEAGGGEWPESPVTSARRRGGHKPKSAEDVYQAALACIKAGVSWRDFNAKHRPSRVLTAEQMEHVKQQFQTAGSHIHVCESPRADS
jgi:hypothetical protein